MKTYRPTSKSRRHMTTLPFKEYVTASEPYKPLTFGFKRDVARNAFGRITDPPQGRRPQEALPRNRFHV